MIRPTFLLAALAAALGLALAGGCGDTETTTRTAPVQETEPPSNAANAGADDSAAVAPGARPAQRVTPLPRIDPRKQIDIVREETVEGGEATEGPTPFDYLWQPPTTTPEPDEPLVVEVPLGLPDLIANVHIPAANPLTKAKWELGRQLYFDPRISQNGTVSCATCHNPEKGWTDQLAVSTGIHGQTGSRSAPTVINTVYGKSMFWDGRAPSLEGQAQGPPQNPIEMGTQSFEEIITRLRAIPGYQEQFRKVFGTEVTLDGLAKAIATFERTILSGNSPYDRYQNGELDAIGESEKRGMVLFGLRLRPDDEFKAEGVTLQKANCTACHVGFNFTDEQFHNLGVGYNESEQAFNDLGRWAITPIGAKNDTDRGAFKTPTLRDLLHTAPYMHDGSEPTLEAVVEYYDRGGNPNEALSADIFPLDLTDQEKADLVAFMKSLTGEATQVELPKLPPGPDGKSPDPRAALTPPKPQTVGSTSPEAELHAVLGF